MKKIIMILVILCIVGCRSNNKEISKTTDKLLDVEMFFENLDINGLKKIDNTNYIDDDNTYIVSYKEGYKSKELKIETNYNDIIIGLTINNMPIYINESFNDSYVLFTMDYYNGNEFLNGTIINEEFIGTNPTKCYEKRKTGFIVKCDNKLTDDSVIRFREFMPKFINKLNELFIDTTFFNKDIYS